MGGFGSLLDEWSTALTINADPSLSTPRTEATVPVDALQSMQPLTQSQPGGAFGDFWSGVGGVLNSGISYWMAKDAAKAGLVSDGRGGFVPSDRTVTQPGVTQQQYQQMQAGGLSNGMLLMLGLGAVALVGVVLLVKD